MSSLPKHLKVLNNSDRENICHSCGVCCHAAIPISKGLNVVIPELYCKYLKSEGDGKTSCSVYETRLDVAKNWCNSLEIGIEKGIFPNECPYVNDLKGYQGTAVLSDKAYQHIRPQIKKAVLEKGMPEWVSESVWQKFISNKDY